MYFDIVRAVKLLFWATQTPFFQSKLAYPGYIAGASIRPA